MTNDEWILYQNIVRSYTVGQNKGEDLLIDLFHTNEQGLIVLLKPPSKRQTSLEIFLFLMTLQQNQQLRLMENQMIDMANQLKDKIKEIDAKLVGLPKEKSNAE